jgi:hypothetical protein
MKILNRMRNKTIAPNSASHAAAEPANGRAESRSKRSRLIARFIANEEGQSIIETSLVMFFILVPTLLGIFSVTMALYTFQRISYAAFASAQVLGQSRGLIADPCAQVVTSVHTVLPGFPAGNFTYTVLITQNVNNVPTVEKFVSTSGTAFTCSGTTSSGQGGYALNNAAQQPVMVEIGYAYNWFPLFGRRLSGTLGTRQAVLVS